MEATPHLQRRLGLWQAVAINMIDMVGIGPFVTLPLIIGYMHGPACIIAWLLGALLSFMDGFVWAELGARWPEAGGSYAFLQNLFGKNTWGRLMAFLLVWQTVVFAPLVLASGAIGFPKYLGYIIPGMTAEVRKAVSGALVICVTVLLYRRIGSIGKISIAMGVIVIGTILWIITGGATHFSPVLAFTPEPGSLTLSPIFFLGLGMATTNSIYSYLGYYNVCHLGGEIIAPQRNIPRAIFISIAGITLLYVGMQIAILGSLPWKAAAQSDFIVSLLFEHLYGHSAAVVATVLVLLIAMSSLFAVLLGYSRIPYAAAVDGNFFPVFARLHPKGQFPYVSLLVLAGIGFCFSLYLKLGDVIKAIIVMRILVQFVGQSIGVIRLHFLRKTGDFPFKMWLFPIPPLIGITVWLFIFNSAETKFKLFALVFITIGGILFLLTSYFQKKWPFKRIEK